LPRGWLTLRGKLGQTRNIAACRYITHDRWNDRWRNRRRKRDDLRRRLLLRTERYLGRARVEGGAAVSGAEIERLTGDRVQCDNAQHEHDGNAPQSEKSVTYPHAGQVVTTGLPRKRPATIPAPR